MQDRATAITIAAILYLITGIGNAIGTIPVTRHLIRNRTLPTFGGIRFYEGGFFDRQGINWVIAASLSYIALGVLFVLVAYWLWNSMSIGGILAVVLFPIVMGVSIGSLAPIPLVIEPIKITLVVVAWNSLN